MNKGLLKNVYGKILGRDAFWAVNKHAARMIGLEESLLLQDLIDRDNQEESIANPKHKGKICPTYQQLSNALPLSVKKVQRLIKTLSEELELIQVKLDQLPAKNHYTIDYVNIDKLTKANNMEGFNKLKNSIFSQTSLDKNGMTCMDKNGRSSSNNLRVRK